MRITMIGHASLFIETQNCRILMDPVLWDPHQEGLFDVFPPRKVLVDRIPKFSFMVLSHRHLDHFDVRSLAALPRAVNVLIPNDPFLERYLRKLGYDKITLLKDFSLVKIGGTSLLTTRSENPVPEYGVVFSDSTGVFWNQVDSIVSPTTVRKVLSYFPKIDLLLAAWQPMLESSFQTNAPVGFPYKRYEEILYGIGLAAPRAVAPGANGFCYTGAASWMNHVVFPVSRERFLEDVRGASSESINTFTFDPGDQLSLEAGTCSHAAQASEMVQRTGGEDRSIFDFFPVIAGGPLIDSNPDGVPPMMLRDAVIDIIERRLGDSLASNPGHFAVNHLWKLVYQLKVVFPNGEKEWHIDFSSDNPKVVSGRNSLANVVTILTASSIHGLHTGSRGWDYAILGSYCRRFHKLYAVGAHGLISGHQAGFVDPLDILFPFQECAERFLDNEISRWSEVRQGETSVCA